MLHITVACGIRSENYTPLESLLCFQSVNTGSLRGTHLFLHLQQVKQSLSAYITVPTLPFPVHSALLSLPFPTDLNHTHFNGEAMNPDSHKGPSEAGHSLPEIHFSTWLETPGAFSTLWFLFPKRRKIVEFASRLPTSPLMVLMLQRQNPICDSAEL